MNRARAAGTRVLLLGLVAAAVAAGNAAAAMSTPKLRLEARLAPVSGSTAVGRFSGLLARTGDGSLPRTGQRWQLAWNISLPALRGSATATLRINAGGGAAAVARPLCTSCGTTAKGTVTLTPNQVFRIARSGAVVIVRAPSARWRGTVRIKFVQRPG